MISSKTHGILDYIIGGLLAGSVYLFDLGNGGPHSWVPFCCGIALLTYSLLTNYEASPVKWLSLRLHLWLDLANGLLLLSSAWLFGFTDQTWWPHAVGGGVLLALALLSDKQAYSRREAHPDLDQQHKVHPDLH
jgi:hypothetical protein